MKATKHAAPLPLAGSRPVPAVLWALLGAGIFVFQLYVLGKWVLGPNFVTTPTGPDRITWGQHVYFVGLQWGVSLAAVACVLYWVVLPRMRTGRIGADGRLFLAGGMIFFWDMSMNYSTTVLLYNSNFVNYGAWNLGSWPGWFSPAANRLPEPIFVTIPGYLALVTTQAMLVCRLLQRAKARWPNLSPLSSLGLIVIGCTVLDTLIELVLVRTEVYAYPGTLRSFALFPGRTYQFPLNEGILFGGLGIGAMTALHYFRDDKGQTFVERGTDRLRIGDTGKQWIRGFAVFGYCHLAFIVLYAVPMQPFSLNSDPYPTGYPSYLLNDMCVYGTTQDRCPGPGVMIPRPLPSTVGASSSGMPLTWYDDPSYRRFDYGQRKGRNHTGE